MSLSVQRATTEPRPTDGAFNTEVMQRGIKDSLEALPENHTYRIHGTRHVDAIGGTFAILRVDANCEWCRADFKLEAQ